LTNSALGDPSLALLTDLRDFAVAGELKSPELFWPDRLFAVLILRPRHLFSTVILLPLFSGGQLNLFSLLLKSNQLL